MSGEVLTVFYLSIGATLIQGTCKAVFELGKSLDEAWFSRTGRVELCKFVLARFLQYIILSRSGTFRIM